jgi:selT/selW/selH-like putative selenoprotein
MRQMSITYCGTCNYRPIAASLAKLIEAETGIKPVLIHSPDIGAFEVTVNDELIFSKSAVGRFPEFSKIIGVVKGKIGSSET